MFTNREGKDIKKYINLVIVAMLLITISPLRGQAASATGSNIVEYAKKFQGVPYLFGGNTPEGFDCSGFLVYIFKEFGISLPRTSASQYEVGVSVEKQKLAVGDLVFFSDTYKAGISHSGVYVGDNKFISATSSGVMIADMNNSYWGPKYTGAKRVLNTANVGVTSSKPVEVKFKDVSDTNYAHTAVFNLSDQGIISGFPDGTFRPNEAVTRGQAAAIINRILKHKAKATTPFSDVGAKHTFAKDIAAIKELGIINGYPDGTYRPNETMTRTQMAVIVNNALLKHIDSDIATNGNSLYKDVSTSYWAYKAIATMKLIDTSGGFKTTEYRGDSKATRGDFATAIYNALEIRY